MSITMISIVQFMILLSLAALWVLERRRRRHDMAQWTDRVIRLESSLSLFMRECEKTFTEVFEKLKVDAPTANSASSVKSARSAIKPIRLVLQEESKSQGTPPNSVKTVPLRAPKSAEATNRNRILRLATQGVPAPEIASQLSIPQGEVELVLNLRRATSNSKKAKPE